MKQDLFIDPGTPFGFCVWDDGELVTARRVPQSDPTWEERSSHAADQLSTILQHYKPRKVYCERPIQMGGHSRASDDNLIKLCLTVGRFVQVCDWLDIPVELVQASWLGQLTSKAIRYRVGQIIEGDVSSIPEHAIDSVAMALFVYGKWPRG